MTETEGDSILPQLRPSLLEVRSSRYPAAATRLPLLRTIVIGSLPLLRCTWNERPPSCEKSSPVVVPANQLSPSMCRSVTYGCQAAVVKTLLHVRVVGSMRKSPLLVPAMSWLLESCASVNTSLPFSPLLMIDQCKPPSAERKAPPNDLSFTTPANMVSDWDLSSRSARISRCANPMFEEAKVRPPSLLAIMPLRSVARRTRFELRGSIIRSLMTRLAAETRRHFSPPSTLFHRPVVLPA